MGAVGGGLPVHDMAAVGVVWFEICGGMGKYPGYIVGVFVE